jgi:hypothetical protein
MKSWVTITARVVCGMIVMAFLYGLLPQSTVADDETGPQALVYESQKGTTGTMRAAIVIVGPDSVLDWERDCNNAKPEPECLNGLQPAGALEEKQMVPGRRLELPRPYGHTDLNRARLPIPPPGQGGL